MIAGNIFNVLPLKGKEVLQIPFSYINKFIGLPLQDVSQTP